MVILVFKKDVLQNFMSKNVKNISIQKIKENYCLDASNLIKRF